MSKNSEANSVKSMLAMVIVGLIALVSMDKGFNGDIIRIAIYGVIGLGLGEKAVEYLFNREKKKTSG